MNRPPLQAIVWMLSEGPSLSQGVPTKVVAASMGLCGFAVTLIAGLAVDNPLDVIVLRAVAAMLVCYVVGNLIGLAAQVAISGTLREIERAAAGARAEVAAEGGASSPRAGKMPTS